MCIRNTEEDDPRVTDLKMISFWLWIPILPKADVEHFVNPRASIVGSGSVSARDTVLLLHNFLGGSEVDGYEIQRVCLGGLWEW